MHSSYQHHATSYANLALGSAHAIVNDLHARAAKLAPRFEGETAEAGCQNPRPGDDQPRRQRVWDMLAEALAWNLIADDVEAVVAAKRLEANGRPYQVGFAWNVMAGERRSYQQPFVVDLNGGELLTYAEMTALEKTVARGTRVVAVGNMGGLVVEDHISVPETPESTGIYCRHCGEEIEDMGARPGQTLWVMVLSGDEGGTYDLCEDNVAKVHQPGGDRPQVVSAV